MIEKIILDHLKTILGDSVYMESPDHAPKEYILVEKTGSSRKDHLNSSLFAFQSYAQSLHRASELNEEVKAAVDTLVELDAISSAKLNSDYNFTDTTTKKYRYQALYDIFHY